MKKNRYAHVASVVTASIMLLSVCTVAGVVSASPASAEEIIFIFPANKNACGFDIEGHFTGGIIDQNFFTFTNLETGATYDWISEYVEVESYDRSTKTWRVITVGKKIFPLNPGDQGPEGLFQGSGELWLLHTGKLDYTYMNNGVVTAWSLDGTYINLCEALSD